MVLLLTGFAYYLLTEDSPEGNYRALQAAGKMPPSPSVNGTFLEAAKDYRVWALLGVYGACFGIELTINNVAALYYHDRFELSIGMAGLIAGLFGLMNIFARTLGGFFDDKLGIKFGLRGRVMFLGTVLALEGLALILFSQMVTLLMAVGAMIFFSLFVQMSEGATFSVVPFINRRALGSVAGIVGAGGNAGAVAAGFLFRVETLIIEGALLVLGIGVPWWPRCVSWSASRNATKPPKEPLWKERCGTGPRPKKGCSLPIPGTKGSTRNPEFQRIEAARHDRSRRS